MARTMPEKQTEVYRTVVRITYLEDGPMRTTWNWDSDKGEYERAPAWYAGQTRTDVFGPYSLKSINQNYSYQSSRVNRYNGETKKQELVKVAEIRVEKQVLKPVLALNEHGALELALDWVRYN